jgi:hypothetical protein
MALLRNIDDLVPRIDGLVDYWNEDEDEKEDEDGWAGSLLRVLRVCYVWREKVMSQFAKDFEDCDPKTAISTNVYGHVTGTKVNNRQCLRGLLRVLRVYTPQGG